MTRFSIHRKWQKPTYGILLLGILLIAFLIRIYKLGAYSMWLDEVDCIYAGIKNIPYHPPLFLKLTLLWLPLGTTDFSLRLLPVLISLIGIVVFWNLARKFCGKYTAAVSAILFATSPPLVYYSREFRMYILLAVLALISWDRFFDYMEKGGTIRLLQYSLSTALVFYTHHFGFYFAVGQAVSGVFFGLNKQSLRRLFSGLFLAGLLYTPWILKLWFLIRRFTGSQYWAESITWKTPFYSWRFFTAGYEPPPWLQWSLGILIALLTIYTLIHCKEKRCHLFILGNTIIPVIAAFIVSAIMPASMFVPRYAIFAIPPVLLAVSWAITSNKKHLLSATILATILIFHGIALTYHYTNTFAGGILREVRPRKEYRQAATYIADHYQQDDGIFTTCESGSLPVWYYLTFRRGLPHSYQVDLDGAYRKHLEPKYNMPELIEMYPFVDLVDIKTLTGNFNRIWLFESGWDVTSNPDDLFLRHSKRIRKWLSERFLQIDHKVFYGVEVRLFDTARVPSDAWESRFSGSANNPVSGK
ncbi:glycosyltransferase family 39 protein [bacterium]|nr:glycosyltransferase family 39 protein [candidate division CSSED10-310 bacterium]